MFNWMFVVSKLVPTKLTPYPQRNDTWLSWPRGGDWDFLPLSRSLTTTKDITDCKCIFQFAKVMTKWLAVSLTALLLWTLIRQSRNKMSGRRHKTKSNASWNLTTIKRTPLIHHVNEWYQSQRDIVLLLLLLIIIVKTESIYDCNKNIKTDMPNWCVTYKQK